MLFQTTQAHEELRAKVRAFAEEEIKPIAFMLDQQNEFPDEAIRKLGEMGLMGIPFPAEYGGAGLDALSYAIAVEELARLEGERCPSMDRAADAFAALLAGAAEEEPDPVRRRVLEQLLYHLGRWIYLVDAADDLKKDVKSGSYNPLVYRFHAEGGTLTAEDRAALAATLDSSVRAMAAAFELADFGPWRAIIESVVYEGLYAVGAAVLNGTFRKGRRRKQRKAGA